MAKYLIDDTTLVSLADAMRGRFLTEQEYTLSEIISKIGEEKWGEDLVSMMIDSDGTLFNGIGYQDGYRQNSSASIVEADTGRLYGYLPVSYLDKICVKCNSGDPIAGWYCYGYDDTFTKVSSLSAGQIETNIVQYIVNNSQTSYIRITIDKNTSEDLDITVRRKI